MVLTVTFSPDGKTIVCAGLTKSRNEESYSIYFFDRESGKLVQRIAALREYITHLTYSRDGRFLVAGMGKAGGIRIYQTSDYFIVREDGDYKESVYGIDFDSKGRLVTVSYDGLLRLYGKDFKLIAKKNAPDGFKPSSIRFSPEGSKIAVSFYDSAHPATKLDILSGEDLSYQYSEHSGFFSRKDHSFYRRLPCWKCDGSQSSGDRYHRHCE